MFGNERRMALEEAVRLLESARGGPAGEGDFDNARLEGHLTTALTATRAALAVANRDAGEGPPEVLEGRET